jgi:hypothetical protein
MQPTEKESYTAEMHAWPPLACSRQAGSRMASELHAGGTEEWEAGTEAHVSVLAANHIKTRT